MWGKSGELLNKVLKYRGRGWQWGGNRGNTGENRNEVETRVDGK